ncbi:MAG: hypothetical protein AB1659_03940 [Thermodesulfobacteriota bacterium]
MPDDAAGSAKSAIPKGLNNDILKKNRDACRVCPKILFICDIHTNLLFLIPLSLFKTLILGERKEGYLGKTLQAAEIRKTHDLSSE